VTDPCHSERNSLPAVAGGISYCFCERITRRPAPLSQLKTRIRVEIDERHFSFDDIVIATILNNETFLRTRDQQILETGKHGKTEPAAIAGELDVIQAVVRGSVVHEKVENRAAERTSLSFKKEGNSFPLLKFYKSTIVVIL
jgi:hypothetical protein